MDKRRISYGFYQYLTCINQNQDCKPKCSDYHWLYIQFACINYWLNNKRYGVSIHNTKKCMHSKTHKKTQRNRNFIAALHLKVTMFKMNLFMQLFIQQVDFIMFQKRISWSWCLENLGGLLVTLSDGLLPFVYLCCHSEYLWRWCYWPRTSIRRDTSTF